MECSGNIRQNYYNTILKYNNCNIGFILILKY